MLTLTETTRFKDFKLRVAIRLGWALAATGGAYSLPTQASTLDKLDRCCNDSAERFWNLRKWNWITRPHDIALDPDDPDESIITADDLTRYALPPGVMGAGEGAASWSASGFGSAALRIGRNALDRLHGERPGESGNPRRYCIYERDVAETGWSSRMGMGVRIFPEPSQACTLSIPVRRTWTRLVEDGQALPWPVVHDRTVMLMAVREAGGTSDGTDTAVLERDIAEALAGSEREDKDVKGSLVGYLPAVGMGSGGARQAPYASECTDFDGNPLSWM